MIKMIRLVASAAVAGTIGWGVLAPAHADAAALTADALVGNWVVNEGTCSDANAEFITFAKNGTVESARNGQVDAVGFWKLENDRIVLDVLAPPARFDEKLKDMAGYYAFDITIATFNVTADAFEGVGILAEQIRYGKFTRCRA
jgi:hypothetical protein